MPNLRLTDKDLEKALLQRFCPVMNMNSGDLYYSRRILKEIAGRFERDITRLRENADEYKHGGVAMFWIKKLKPICVRQGQRRYLNEMFAFYVGVGAVIAGKRASSRFGLEPALYMRILGEMWYALRYRNMTPQNMDYILKLMFPPVES